MKRENSEREKKYIWEGKKEGRREAGEREKEGERERERKKRENYFF